MNDRALGYIVMGILFSFVVVCIATAMYVVFSPRETRYISFDHVGTLKVDDPVAVQGLQVGKISKVEWCNKKQIVTFKSKTPLHIYKNYRISMSDVGLMGERAVTLDCGTSDRPETAPYETLSGAFLIGPSEAIGYMYKLKEVVTGFVRIARMLENGDSTHKSMATQIGQAVKFVDSLSIVLVDFSTDLEQELSSSMDTLSSLVVEATALSATATKEIPGYVKSINSDMAQIQKLLVEVDQMLVKIQPLVKTLTGPQAQEFQKKLSQLTQQLKTVDDLMADLKAKGLNLKVRLF
jgi:ABC-type transporter Mla subunit MlaD